MTDLLKFRMEDGTLWSLEKQEVASYFARLNHESFEQTFTETYNDYMENDDILFDDLYNNADPDDFKTWELVPEVRPMPHPTNESWNSLTAVD